jgi:hypothetical protein
MTQDRRPGQTWSSPPAAVHGQVGVQVGNPPYGYGAGNSTIDLRRDAVVVDACHNTMLCMTSDSIRCSADGNLFVSETIYDAVLKHLRWSAATFGRSERVAAQKGHVGRRGTPACRHGGGSPKKLAEAQDSGFPRPKVQLRPGDGIGKGTYLFSEKLTNSGRHKSEGNSRMPGDDAGHYEVRQGLSCASIPSRGAYPPSRHGGSCCPIMVRRIIEANAGASTRYPMSSISGRTWGQHAPKTSVSSTT